MSDFRQWPWYMKVAFPLWFPLFLVLATVLFVGGMLVGGVKCMVDVMRGQR
jgi:hypothetical protein